MIKNLVFLLVMGGGFAFIVFQIYQFIYSVSASRSRLQRDAEELTVIANEMFDELAPMNRDDIEILCPKLNYTKTATSMYYTEKGHLSTIYNEPVVAYAYRRYQGAKSVLVAVTRNVKYIFQELDINVSLSINGYNQGIIDQKGGLTSLDGNLLAQLTFLSSQTSELMIGDRMVARLNSNEAEEVTENSRTFAMLQTYDEKEENILVAMSLYHILLKDEINVKST